MLHNDESGIIDFEAARASALEGVADYLQNRRNAVGDRFGQHHGAMGKRRARNLAVLLNQLGENSQHKNANILAVLLAVFTNSTPSTSFFKNPFRNIGRSSKLASFIADQWIAGDIDHTARPPRTVTSHVFTRSALERASNNYSNHRSTNVELYFDNTKGAREILKSTLNSPLFQNEREKIIESLPKLRNYLELNEENVSLRARLELPFPVNPAEEMGPTLSLRKNGMQL